MRTLLILPLILMCQFSWAQNKLFPKMRNQLKISDYLIEGNNSKYDIPNEVKFIILQKKVKEKHHEGLFLLSFGCENHTCFEIVKLKNDTLFYSLDKENQVFIPLFILKRKAIGDTIFVRKFGVLENQKIVLEQEFYSKKLNDTLFSYQLINDLGTVDNLQGKRIDHSGDQDKICVTEIAISIKHGFVWVKYKYFGVCYEVRFY